MTNLCRVGPIFIITILSILIKLAIAPFHLWIVSIGAKVGYFVILWLLIPQKLIPLSILSNINYFRSSLLLSRLFFRTLHSLTQTKIKKIIIMSSVFSINWIYLRIMLTHNVWIIYFITYSIISFSVIIILSDDLSNNLITGFINKTLINQKLITIILLFISGIPPRPIFFIKILIIYRSSRRRWVVLLTIILCSILIIYIYLNSLLYSSLISNKSYFISFAESSNKSIISIIFIFRLLMISFLF